MGNQLKKLNLALKNFIKNQKIFFVGTARTSGTVNVSPKGMDTFKIVNNNKIVWLNLTGSGNETAAHLLENNRMTIMFCSFEKTPLILRLYGKAQIYHENDRIYDEQIVLYKDFTGARQIIEMEINLVQTSCGYAVPLMEFKEERTQLNESDIKKERAGVKKYWEDHNVLSLDGFKAL
jgi:hypothetical protein